MGLSYCKKLHSQKLIKLFFTICSIISLAKLSGLSPIYKFQFCPYERPFRQPLNTSHGTWEVREGIILKLTDSSGKIGWGEIAPLPWFGSETLAAALAFCEQLNGKVTAEIIAAIPENLPACQFGFESAILDIFETQKDLSQLNYSYLLPAGADALKKWPAGWKKGGRTFKWKIGVYSLTEELKLFEKLMQALPANAKLRLDANGGLSYSQAEEWLKNISGSHVEFMEQPLPPQELAKMLKLSEKYSTPLALDESVATLKQLEQCYSWGWKGIYVIKAAIAGSPQRLRQFCRTTNVDVVFSSVFETNIGKKAALNLARELSNPNRAVGFGVENWFLENDEQWLNILFKYD